MRNSYQTALLIAVLVKRSGERRARVSEKTFKLVGQRKRLHATFIVKVTDVLEADFGISMVELDTGGFGVIHVKSLEAAKAITVKRFMTPGELQEIRSRQPLDTEPLLVEVSEDETGHEESE